MAVMALALSMAAAHSLSKKRTRAESMMKGNMPDRSARKRSNDTPIHSYTYRIYTYTAIRKYTYTLILDVERKIKVEVGVGRWDWVGSAH